MSICLIDNDIIEIVYASKCELSTQKATKAASSFKIFMSSN